MNLIFVMILIFTATSLTTYLILWFPTRKSAAVSERLRKVRRSSSQSSVAGDFPSDIPGITSPLNLSLERIIAKLGSISEKKDQDDSELKLSLMQAGFYRENSIRVFRSLRIAVPLAMLAVGILIGVAGQGKNPVLFMFALILPAIGYLLPGVVLRKLVTRRQEEIARGLPDALDFLVICVEAGLGLNSAIIRVGHELRLRSRALGEELLLVNRDMRGGITREQALRNLCERNQTKDLKTVVGSLLLADRLGTSIADTLRAQSDSLRTRVRQRAEEQAAKASVKMLFPLIFLILPALFIVLLGPGIILALRALGPMAQ